MWEQRGVAAKRYHHPGLISLTYVPLITRSTFAVMSQTPPLPFLVNGTILVNQKG